MNQPLFEAIVMDHKRLVHHINENAWKYQSDHSKIQNPFAILKDYLSSKATNSNSNACCAPCC